jgi:LPXTG-motif cell wall-anchored protein
LKSRVVAALAVTALVSALGVGPAFAQASVSMEDNFFSPAAVTITVGESVTWTNNGVALHTSTGPGWDSGAVGPGGSFSFTFNSAGTFDYVCTFHEVLGMVGTVTVLAAGGNGTLPPTGPSSRSGPFVAFGVALLLGGAAVLLALRRRRA